jgi:hypothetical protein
MARRKQTRASSGAPGISNGIGPALNPLGLQQANPMRHGNFLDPTTALGKVPHPSAEWADIELQPCKPRE